LPENTGDSTIKTPEKPQQNEGETVSNFRITDPRLGEGGAKAKYGFNIEAIRVVS